MPAVPVLTIGQATISSGDRVRIPCDLGDVRFVIALLTDSNGNYDPTTPAIASYNVSTSGVGAPTISAKQLDNPYTISAFVVADAVGTYEITYSAVLTDPDATEIERTGSLVVK